MDASARRSGVKWLLGGVALLALGLGMVVSGCGGSSETTTPGEVSGVIFDQEGFVVRGARVYFDGSGGRDTQSTTTGTYTLTQVPARDLLVRAEIDRNGVRYYGQNLATVLSGERSKNVNIAVYPESQLATLRGDIRDREGRSLRGVRVFLRPLGGSENPDDAPLLTSAVGISNSDGRYSIGGLLGGLTYEVQVNGLGYNSSFDSVTLNAGESRELDFNVPDGDIINVPAPELVGLVSFSSPEATRSSARMGNAIEAMKQRLRPWPLPTATRTTVRGNPIEIDLFWNRIDNTALLGFGIYRGVTGQTLRNTSFLRDPQAVFFADTDDSVIENVSYTYAVTSLDTLYDGNFGESEASNALSIAPLGDLILGSVTSGTNPTFRWNEVANATSYGLYIFSEYPDIGVSELDFVSGITGASYVYDRANLTRGRTYYFIVYAEREQGEDSVAYAFSQVGQFTVP
jgi:hypothetical protein